MVLRSCLLAAMALGVAAPAIAQTASPARTATIQLVQAQRSGTGVTVLKGTPSTGHAAAEDAAPPAAAPAVGDNVVIGSGGRHMWMVDRATGQVTDCQSLATSSPGQRRIACTTQPLPVQ